MLSQIIAACLSVAVTLLDKIALSKYKTNVSHYLIAIFIFLWLSSGLTLPWLAKIDVVRAFSLSGIAIFALLIFFAFVWNIIYYRSQQKETIQEFELIVMTLPLFTAIAAAIFFPDERNWQIFFATLVAAIALILAHLRKDHLTFNKYSWLLIVAIIFMAAEAQVRKVLLDWYSPASLYFLRTGVLTVLFIFYLRPRALALTKPVWWHAAISGVLGATEMILIFYGYKELGIVMTTLILMLGPILVYLLDFVLLKEKLRPKIIAAAFVILGCIIYAGIMA